MTFKEIASAIRDHCEEVKSKRGIAEANDIDAIMTDLPSHCGMQFKDILTPCSKPGHTLFHVSKCIQVHIFEVKGFRKLFYKDHGFRAYCRSLIYIQFSNQGEIKELYQFLKRIFIRACKTVRDMFKSMDKVLINKTKKPIHNFSYEDKIKHRTETTEAQHKVLNMDLKSHPPIWVALEYTAIEFREKSRKAALLNGGIKIKGYKNKKG